MKHNKFFILLPVLLLVLNSCKKSFLDIDNTSQLFRQSYVKDLNSMQEFMNGVQAILGNSGYENPSTAAYPDLVADNLKPLPAPPAAGAGTQAFLAHYTWTQQPNELQGSPTDITTDMNSMWVVCYQLIRACSFVIEDIGKYRDENAVLADDIKGQAFAIRAMIHFRLVNIFAQAYKFTPGASHPGVPYITTSNIGKPYSRQTVAEVYNGMIADLNGAIQLLRSSVTDTRFMNIAAAKGLLARVYLFMEDYAKAEDIAEEISDQFPLLTIAGGYPNDVFKHKSPGQSEVLYRLTPINQPGTVSAFLAVRLKGPLFRFRPTDDIVNILIENPNDIRYGWATNSGGFWNVSKFPSSVTPELPEVTRAETAYYLPVIRSSEMFLTVAEAAAKTGDENKAREYLNAIRKRADPSIALVTATGPALLDSIYKERRKELCFEGLRMYDLQRWKLGVHRIDALTGAPKDLPYPHDKAVSPIPILETTLAGIPPNPGY